MLHSKKINILLILFSFLLSGCLDDIADTDTGLSTTKTGIFIDSVVEGLSYECSSGTKGITDEKGEFTCDSNNTISFFLGENNLGTSQLLDYITPYTLFKDNNTSALNLAQLLQSLDNDKNLSNGIKIDAKLLLRLGNTISFDSLSFDEDMQELLGSDNQLVSEKVALANIELEFIKININNDGSYPRIKVDNPINTAPVLSLNSTLSALENQTYALTVSAVDKESDLLIYSMNAGDANSFTIDPSSGVILFKVAPNFEEKSLYEFTVYVSDKALSDSKDITLHIINTGEIIPILSNSVSAVPENSLTNATVGNIIIQSIGDSEISHIRLSGLGNENFIVDSKGLITVSPLASLDYEKKRRYHLTAIANNLAGLSERVNVDISVTNIGEHAILSAVYDDKKTDLLEDDLLYLYMSQSIEPLSMNADRSLNYTIEGSGVLNSDVQTLYDDSLFHRDIINISALSTKLESGVDKIIINKGQITDEYGATAVGSIETLVEKFNIFPLLATGQILSYPIIQVENNTTENNVTQNKDDGYYKKSFLREYSLDNDTNETIIDNITGLIWQKEDDSKLRKWSDASEYCDGISLNENGDFRLPTIHELVSITDKARFNPAINPIFINTKNSSNYWSSSLDNSDTLNAWFVFFYAGHALSGSKDSLNYIRCVSELNPNIEEVLND